MQTFEFYRDLAAILTLTVAGYGFLLVT